MATEYRPIPRLAVGVYPLTNVTPFTYRDGVTYERLLHQLVDRMNTIIGEVNDGNRELFDTVIEHMNDTIDAVNNALGEQTDEVDQKLADLTDYVDIEVQKIVDMRDDMEELRDETETFRNQAETFAAGTVALQDEAVATLINTPGSDTQTKLDATVATLIDTPGSDTQAQLNETVVTREENPSGMARWYMAPVNGADGAQLYAEYHSGWLAQRFSIGIDGVDENLAQLAPSIEVHPAYPHYRPDLEGDWGANLVDPVTCIQLYRYGHGDTTDREYFYMEAFGNGERFQIGTHFSGTGTANRPVEWKSAGVKAWTVRTDAVMQINKRLYIGDDAQVNPFMIERTGTGNDIAIRRVSSDANPAQIMLSKARGTIGAETAPQLGNALGDIRAGFENAGGPYWGGILRFIASEDWNIGTSQGTHAQIHVTKGGTATREIALQLSVPGSSRETSATLLIDLGGTLVSKKVHVGDPDSGGTGYRSLRVEN